MMYADVKWLASSEMHISRTPNRLRGGVHFPQYLETSGYGLRASQKHEPHTSLIEAGASGPPLAGMLRSADIRANSNRPLAFSSRHERSVMEEVSNRAICGNAGRYGVKARS